MRGLALRSLSSLRLPSIVEYLVPPIQRALRDASPYVRKTGVAAILKLFHIAPHVVQEADMTDTLYSMLRDVDPQVVVNCITVLRELMAEEGGMAINQPIVHHLLNRVKEFSEWGLCVVLDLVAEYKPGTPEETFAIMNLLDECLRFNNSAVVLATTKCFLSLTRETAAIHEQVYIRLRDPLLTLLSTTSHEVAYVVLSHIKAIAHYTAAFNTEYKQFFCK